MYQSQEINIGTILLNYSLYLDFYKFFHYCPSVPGSNPGYRVSFSLLSPRLLQPVAPLSRLTWVEEVG